MFRLNWADAGKGLLVAFLTVFTGGLITVLQLGGLPSLEQMQGWAISGLAAALAYLIKNLFTNSGNQLLTPDPPKQD
jgi:hypothetical protein